MKFAEFKRTCVGRQCKIVKSEVFCPDEKHPIYHFGWNDNSAKHKFLNVPRVISKVSADLITFTISNVPIIGQANSHATVPSAKDFHSRDKGFTIESTENWGSRLTYEWV